MNLSGIGGGGGGPAGANTTGAVAAGAGAAGPRAGAGATGRAPNTNGLRVGLTGAAVGAGEVVEPDVGRRCRCRRPRGAARCRCDLLGGRRSAEELPAGKQQRLPAITPSWSAPTLLSGHPEPSCSRWTRST